MKRTKHETQSEFAVAKRERILAYKLSTPLTEEDLTNVAGGVNLQTGTHVIYPISTKQGADHDVEEFWD